MLEYFPGQLPLVMQHLLIRWSCSLLVCRSSLARSVPHNGIEILCGTLRYANKRSWSVRVSYLDEASLQTDLAAAVPCDSRAVAPTYRGV